MFDPFPFRANPLLSDFTHGIASKIYLQTLSLHIHEVILSALAYHIVCVFVSPYLSSRIFPRTYPSLPWRTKLNWDVHVVSLVQSIMICSLAFYTLINDDERNRMDYRERIWGYTGATGLIDALATGYFAWDLYMSATHIGVFGLGLLAHASCALLVYLLGFVRISLSRRGLEITMNDFNFCRRSDLLSTIMRHPSSSTNCPRHS